MFVYRGADKSLVRPTNDVFCSMVRIFRLMLIFLYMCVCACVRERARVCVYMYIYIYIHIYIYINSINIFPIVIINRIYEHQNFLLL